MLNEDKVAILLLKNLQTIFLSVLSLLFFLLSIVTPHPLLYRAGEGGGRQHPAPEADRAVGERRSCPSPAPRPHRSQPARPDPPRVPGRHGPPQLPE